jgi:rhamnose utilization protein RhaD (predicted bifunctional aldolase and dehydrogenase)/NAD(P)-dependent dehydrogenase (short-subunit alcohol dehydrogenase family)
MESRWIEADAPPASEPLALRTYTSRLLGQEPALVLHGGGNTSVKISQPDFFGDPTDVCYIKGSGWDLATIEPKGFAPVRLQALLKLATLPQLSDADMVAQQRAAMLDPDAPAPSIEAILHAIIPFTFVDHTHADAVVALTNHPDGASRVETVYGARMIVVPYVMPGFILAKTVAGLIADRDLRADGVDGMILLNHGIFTFHDDARRSYELMIELVTMAERYLAGIAGDNYIHTAKPTTDPLPIAALRQAVSQARGTAVVAQLDQSPEAAGFSLRADAPDLGTRGPLTPDHSIRTKRAPAFIDPHDPATIAPQVASYAADYRTYFGAHQSGQMMLDPAPRWTIVKGYGLTSFGTTKKEARIIADIARHTASTLQLAAACGGWRPLPQKDIFEIEYWDLEQAKLKMGGQAPVHQGKVALVTGAAAGIGLACAQALAEQGATVLGVDLNPEIVEAMQAIGAEGKVVNLTDDSQIEHAIHQLVLDHGGLDILVSNAGIFTAGQYLDDLEDSNWERSMAVNLTSHQKLLRRAIPFLKLGVDPAIVLVGSRNVAAPGAGAASYSCAKAGLTQLCRVAALELAPHGVRCNIIHPDAVFDTKLWTPEALQRSAERYGLTVEEYKTRNLMKTEIKSRDIGLMVSAMASPLFGKTTGAQLPVDGGNDRVI